MRIKNNRPLASLGRISFRIFLAFIIVAGITLFVWVLSTYKDALEPISYLPAIKIEDLVSRYSDEGQVDLSNDFFKLLVDPGGNISITTLKGETIISGLIYYAAHENCIEKIGLENVVVEKINDGTVSITGSSLNGEQISIKLTSDDNNPKLDIHVNTNYQNSAVVLREALIAKFDVPVTKVYRKNRQVDEESFEPEYWLDKQGIRFGKGERAATIYHTPLISSLQADTKSNLLYFNLDFHLDHPHINIPYQEDGGRKWVDNSSSNYDKDTGRENHFAIYFGEIPATVPRLMLIPKGFTAGYVFTEHADETSIATQRAVYFGSEEITDASKATGGFVGNRIPVTKSVFYSNIGDTINMSIYNSSESSEYTDFLDQLSATGLYDICLHTPEFLNSNRALLEESIEFMKRRFNTVTWIDHGCYSGKENRESFVCDGFNSGSDFYVADLWQKYNTLYFWNTAVELHLKRINASLRGWRAYLSPREMEEMGVFLSAIELLKRRKYDGKYESNSFLKRKGDGYPTPLYYQHPTLTGQFYSWPTTFSKEYGNLSENEGRIESDRILRLIEDWGVFINHGYFPRIRSGNDVINEVNGKFVIDPFFNQILHIMSEYRDEGDLFITTIRELINYWIMIEKISFEYLLDGTIRVNNNNDLPIHGLSMAVRARDIRVNGKLPHSKLVGEDIIFWFDIPGKKHAVLQLNP